MKKLMLIYNQYYLNSKNILKMLILWSDPKHQTGIVWNHLEIMNI